MYFFFVQICPHIISILYVCLFYRIEKHIYIFLVLFSGLNACEKKSFVFLRKELPVRLANIMKEIALLPDSLLRMPSVGVVSQAYELSFQEVIKYEKLEPTQSTVEQ